jgi:phosphopantothenate---cysteine ligase (CTP)
MKILITSGGTKIPIDSVRHIGNMSSGTFGSKIARVCLERGHDVTFLMAAGSKSPFVTTIHTGNLPNMLSQNVKDLIELDEFRRACGNRWMDFKYNSFESYAESLEFLVKNHKFDVVCLAAAVSDYGVAHPFAGKIRSVGNMDIHLEPLQKLIGKVKEWDPNVKLVGFKLLVNSTESQLIEAAEDSVKKNGCDLVVANDLRDIKGGEHRIILVSNKHHPLTYRTKCDEVVVFAMEDL